MRGSSGGGSKKITRAGNYFRIAVCEVDYCTLRGGRRHTLTTGRCSGASFARDGSSLRAMQRMCAGERNLSQIFVSARTERLARTGERRPLLGISYTVAGKKFPARGCAAGRRREHAQRTSEVTALERWVQG